MTFIQSKKNSIMPPVGKWIELETTLSETNKTQTNTAWFSLTEESQSIKCVNLHIKTQK